MDEEVVRFRKDEFVDIFGRTVTVGIGQSSGELVVPLKDVKQTGYKVFKRHEFHKLIVTHNELTQEFDMYLLGAAKDYMLQNKIHFEPAEVLASIEKCKEMLLKKNNNHSGQLDFLRNHAIRQNLGPIQIVSPSRDPTPLTVENVQRHEVEQEEAVKQVDISLDVSEISSTASESSPASRSAQTVRHKTNGSPSLSKNGQHDSNRWVKREKLPQVTFDKDVHQVIVSCVKSEKPHNAWVRDLDSQDLMIDIYNKISKYEPEQKSVQKRELNLETLYLAKDGDDWFRCKVIKFSPLTVFFVDYGNICLVTQVKNIPPQVANVPCQAILIRSFDKKKFVDEDEIRIKIMSRHANGDYLVEVLGHVPENIPAPKPRSEKYFTPPAPFSKLINGQRVCISSEADHCYYLRTKECIEKLDQVTQAIERLEKKPLATDVIEMRQLVLCEKDDFYYRGIVTAKRGPDYKIQLIDYNETVTVPLRCLAAIDQWLATQPQTYLKSPPLKGFANKVLNATAQEFLKVQIDKRTKYNVVLSHSNEFDLQNGTTLLSGELSKLMSAPKIPAATAVSTAKVSTAKIATIKDLDVFKADLGVGPFLCACLNSLSDVTLIPVEELSKNTTIIKESLEDTKPFRPSVDELCYGLYEGEWYRCVVKSVEDATFELLLIDFGNTTRVTSKDIRRIDEDFKQVPILGLQCQFVDYPDRSNIKEIIKSHVIDGEVYQVNLKHYKNGVYGVEIPKVYAILNA